MHCSHIGKRELVLHSENFLTEQKAKFFYFAKPMAETAMVHHPSGRGGVAAGLTSVFLS